MSTQPGSRLERVRADQITALYRNAPPGMAATMVAGVVLEQWLLSTGGVSAPAMHVWVVVLVVQTLARLALCEIRRRRTPPPGAWRRWAMLFTLGALTGGVTWGTGSLFMMVPGHFDYQLLVVMTITALVYGSVSAFGSYPPAFYAFFLPALLPVTIWSALQPDAAHRAFAVLSAIWIPVIILLARRHSRMATESLDLRYENLDLLQDLQRQRDRAEQANIAKSQFLASASHDLRQPVHALGMFVGALRAPRDAASGAAAAGPYRRLGQRPGRVVHFAAGYFAAGCGRDPGQCLGVRHPAAAGAHLPRP